MPRHWFYFLSTVLWITVSSILLWRGVQWTHDAFETVNAFLFIGISLAVTVGLYALGFHVIVRKNAERIARLPERAAVWRLSSPHGYVMIGFMMLLGITIRNSDIPRVYVAGPYLVMGGCLLMGSIQFAVAFVRSLQTAPSSRSE